MTVEQLVASWLRSAEAYSRQVAEARAAGLDHACMLGMATALRQCANDLKKAEDFHWWAEPKKEHSRNLPAPDGEGLEPASGSLTRPATGRDGGHNA